MPSLPARTPSPKLPIVLSALLTLASPALAADDPADGAPRGPAVTVLKAAKACFDNNVEVSGIVLAREETFVRPERLGLKVSEILADAGDTVTAGQNLARLALPEGGLQVVEARRVETGLMSAGQVEIKDGLAEGDIVVARAGALLREGDPVRTVTSADAK